MTIKPLRRYYANVAISCVDYFEKKLEERIDKITLIEKDNSPRTSDNGTKYIRYILEAEEGLIDSKWELEE